MGKFNVYHVRWLGGDGYGLFIYAMDRVKAEQMARAIIGRMLRSEGCQGDYGGRVFISDAPEFTLRLAAVMANPEALAHR
jgi:hypothetical protein